MPTKFSGFEEIEERLEDLAEYFEQRAVGRAGSDQPRDPETGQFLSRDSFEPKRRIGVGIQRALNEEVIRNARTRAKRFVPDEDAETIDFRKLEWNRYQVGGNDMVSYHEFGTSTQADDTRRATINAPNENGYVIPVDGYDSLPFGSDAVAQMDELNFQFVVHPGVEGHNFVENTVKGSLAFEKHVKEKLEEISVGLR